MPHGFSDVHSLPEPLGDTWYVVAAAADEGSKAASTRASTSGQAGRSVSL